MDTNTEFKYRVAQVVSGDYRQDDIVPVCRTPELVRSVGFEDSQIVITQRHIRSCLASEETATEKENHHDLPIDFMDNLPNYIEHPAMILTSRTQADSIVIVSECTDKKNRPIIVALKNAGTGTVGGKVISCNILTSAYGRNGFSEFLNNSLKSDGLLFCDMKKSRDLVVSAGLQLPSLLAKYDSNTIIRKYNENVNTFKQKILTNPKNYLPEQYGQTLYRKDGLPFAYTDPDGRQKQYEYTKTLDGNVVLRSTTVTFPDGRSETTDYSDRGNVIGIARDDANGRATYRYSSDDIGYYASEKSIEYHDNDDYFARKSVHEKTREKIAERGYYHDTAKESWTETDERDNTVLRKYNVYGDNGKIYHATETRYSYDSYGNVVSRIDKDGSVEKTEYYPPSKVRDYFNYQIDDYDAGAIDHNKVKSVTSRYADGSIRIKSYTIDGKNTQVDYSADGQITSFCNENGETFRGTAAERAYLKSCGQMSELTKSSSNKTSRPLRGPSKGTKNDKGKPNGKPSGNSGRGGSSGAGR